MSKRNFERWTANCRQWDKKILTELKGYNSERPTPPIYCVRSSTDTPQVFVNNRLAMAARKKVPVTLAPSTIGKPK